MQNLSILYKRNKNFLKRNFKDKLLFFQAFILCGISRALVLFVSFGKIKKYIGTYNKESSFDLDTENYKVIKKVAWAVERASEYTPWESKCLVKALTAQKLLKSRCIFSTLYLGIAKDGKKDIKAHAWLRSGNVIVTGGNEREGFKEVAKFSN